MIFFYFVYSLIAATRYLLRSLFRRVKMGKSIRATFLYWIINIRWFVLFVRFVCPYEIGAAILTIIVLSRSPSLCLSGAVCF